MIEILKANPLLLLFLVIAIGYWIGRIRIWGSSVGVAAVLFVGLAFGALDAELTLPLIVLELGLVLFVYTIGLANGPGFFSKFRRDGLRELLFITGIMILPALLLIVVHFTLDLTPATTSGIFAGMSNNTPALAGVLDLINSNGVNPETAASEAVVGFSVTYPLGVLARILVLALMLRFIQVNFDAEAYELRKQYPIAQDLQYRTIEVVREECLEQPLQKMQHEHNWDVLFGRLYRENDISLIIFQRFYLIGYPAVMIIFFKIKLFKSFYITVYFINVKNGTRAGANHLKKFLLFINPVVFELNLSDTGFFFHLKYQLDPSIQRVFLNNNVVEIPHFVNTG